MCKNCKTAREIAAAARTYLTKLQLMDSTMIASTIYAYTQAGIIGQKEANAWASKRGRIETVVCDDCGAMIPNDFATILGDNDLCLCESCKDRTCGPQMTHDEADAISDGHGDFEGAQTELDRAIADINAALPKHRRSESGSFPASWFGLTGDDGAWMAFMDEHGEVEVSGSVSMDGRPHIVRVEDTPAFQRGRPVELD